MNNYYECKERFVVRVLLQRQPADTILNKNLLEATSSKYWQGELLEHQRNFLLLRLRRWNPPCAAFFSLLFWHCLRLKTVINKRKIRFAIVLRLLSSQTFWLNTCKAAFSRETDYFPPKLLTLTLVWAPFLTKKLSTLQVLYFQVHLKCTLGSSVNPPIQAIRISKLLRPQRLRFTFQNQT